MFFYISEERSQASTKDMLPHSMETLLSARSVNLIVTDTAKMLKNTFLKQG